MYRPQFAYPTPDGFVDQDFDHYFDQHIAPLLAPGAGYGDLISSIPLVLDKDADFLWRGVKIPNLTGVGPYSVGLQFRGPDGRYLTAGFVPIWLFGLQPSQDDTLTGGPGCILEPEIYCPKGSVILVDQLSLIAGANYQVGTIVLTGVKRWPKESCCGETCRA